MITKILFNGQESQLAQTDLTNLVNSILDAEHLQKIEVSLTASIVKDSITIMSDTQNTSMVTITMKIQVFGDDYCNYYEFYIYRAKSFNCMKYGLRRVTKQEALVHLERTY